MKLASLKSGRDGKLVVVSRDLTRCAPAAGIAITLQAALDEWSHAEPRLRTLFNELDGGDIDGEPFDEGTCASPLPRAYQWADGSAYINHVELVRRARGAEVPESFYTDPLMYQGGSDAFLAPRDPIPLGDPGWGCDLEGEIAVITDDVPMGIGAEAAARHIRLVMLCNDVSLRNLIPGELAKGFGFFQSKPPSAFSPVAVTPDELGERWRDARLHLPLVIDLNGAPFGRAEAGIDATFSLAELVAHAARTRPLSAGTIIGSGTVSNRGADGGPGKPVAQGGAGYSCIAEIRMIETILEGAPRTGFLKDGDRVTIAMRDEEGNSIFGAIDQVVRSVRGGAKAIPAG
jgi:fumarylacetoacetate (FAA) hydrolase